MSQWRGVFSKSALEGLIIVASILLALAADEWRDSARDQREGEEYVARLIADLEADTARLGGAITSLGNKRGRLVRLLSFPQDSRELPYAQIAQDLAAATIWSWVFVDPSATTFEEMRDSGKLGLIRDTGARMAVLSYYRDFANGVATVEARRTSFGPLSYSLVLRAGPEEGAGESDFAPAASSPADLSVELNAEVFASMRQQARAEASYAQYALRRAEGLRETAAALLQRLQDLSEP